METPKKRKEDIQETNQSPKRNKESSNLDSEQDSCALCLEPSSKVALNPHNCRTCVPNSWSVCQTCNYSLLSRRCPICRSEYAPLLLYSTPGLHWNKLLDPTTSPQDRMIILARMSLVKDILARSNVAVWSPSTNLMTFSLPQNEKEVGNQDDENEIDPEEEEALGEDGIPEDEIFVGMKVRCRWSQDALLYPGTVSEINRPIPLPPPLSSPPSPPLVSLSSTIDETSSSPVSPSPSPSTSTPSPAPGLTVTILYDDGDEDKEVCLERLRYSREHYCTQQQQQQPAPPSTTTPNKTDTISSTPPSSLSSPPSSLSTSPSSSLSSPISTSPTKKIEKNNLPPSPTPPPPSSSSSSSGLCCVCSIPLPLFSHPLYSSSLYFFLLILDFLSFIIIIIFFFFFFFLLLFLLLFLSFFSLFL